MTDRRRPRAIWFELDYVRRELTCAMYAIEQPDPDYPTVQGHLRMVLAELPRLQHAVEEIATLAVSKESKV